jgi:hypothetical protein
MTVTSEAFQRELSDGRRQQRGDVFRGTASFRCENPRCSVGIVRIGFVEERGGPSLSFQWPLHCPRCRTVFAAYIGLEVGR